MLRLHFSLAILLVFVTTSNSFLLLCARGKLPHPESPSSAGSFEEKAQGASWVDRLQELAEYRQEHGHTMVPRRYKKNPALGNWVSKQRQQYRRFSAKEIPCSLTEEKIRALESVGFQWEICSEKNYQAKRDEAWWIRMEELKTYRSAQEKLSSSLNAFLREQRKERSNLNDTKLSALRDWDANWWKTSRDLQWELRYQELLEYREEHGDCCIPISYRNRQLANWVSNLRKRYNLRLAGKPSTLTQEQIDKLNAVDFVWNRWEYEFDVKNDEFSKLWANH